MSFLEPTGARSYSETLPCGLRGQQSIGTGVFGNGSAKMIEDDSA